MLFGKVFYKKCCGEIIARKADAIAARNANSVKQNRARFSKETGRGIFSRKN